MNQLIHIPSVQTMTSREIAALTGKEHRHVLRDIEVMLKELDLNKEGYAQTWTHPQNGQTYPEYALDRELTDTLLTGYSALARRAVIRRWHELEAAAKQQTPVQQFKVVLPDFDDPIAAASAWIEAKKETRAKELELKSKQLLLEQQRPAVEFVEKYVNTATGDKGFREVCKLIKVTEARFRKFLTEERIMYKLGGAWMPYQNHIDAGRFTVRTGMNESNSHSFTAAKFTPKGFEWITGEWAKFTIARPALAGEVALRQQNV